MNKAFLSKAFFFAVVFSAIAVNAQINDEAAVSAASIELQTAPSNSPANQNTAETPAKIVNRAFNQPKRSDANADPAARQQVYVRPTREQRLKRYLSDAFGVPALIGSAFGATINQIGNDPPEWRRNASGFGKRFASSYGTNAIRNTVSYGLSETFKLDNRFEKSGQKNFGKRLKHVFLGSYTTRTKTGKRIPDFPHFVGTYSAAVIANETWMPDRFSYKDGLRDGTVSLGIRFGVNLLREFIFPK